jgi:hypothetical protein
MQITLYRRSYPVADAPVALSFARDPAGQRHTFVAGGRVYEAERRELLVIVPNGATIDVVKNRLCWAGDKGPVKSTAQEVFDMAQALLSGFRLAE